MNLAQRQGQYCGGSVTIAGKQDVSGGATHGLLLPTSTWADNFSHLSATYNPVNLAGRYHYVWQAGSVMIPGATPLTMKANGVVALGATCKGAAFPAGGNPVRALQGR